MVVDIVLPTMLGLVLVREAGVEAWGGCVSTVPLRLWLLLLLLLMGESSPRCAALAASIEKARVRNGG